MRFPLNDQENFIPNDIFLDSIQNSFIILTGPNMGGKTTLLRQIALIAIMGQIGCPVPASKCSYTTFDSILIRIGSKDNIFYGKSTFMNEMDDISNMTMNATSDSLVIIDELGRGTSFTDGTSIAISTIMYLIFEKGCLGIFATHLHDLSNILSQFSNISNSHMSYKFDINDVIVFLYKLISGPCPYSFGFEAAKVSGLHSDIIARAKILSNSCLNQVSIFSSQEFHLTSLITFLAEKDLL